MPYGIKVMTGHMQRVLENLLGPIKQQPFQDDIPVASNSTEAHIQDVKQVLELLTYQAKLRIRLEKCKFFKTEARVLGYWVSREGTQVDPKKAEAILKWIKPVDGKGMQRFLGAVNYNRGFSPDFAKICAPLECLRHVSGQIQWSEETSKAFEEVKNFFAQEIILRHIDWKKDMYLTTDASISGIGAWIGQLDHNQQLQPVVCVSKKMTPTQQRWSATKRELWGLMWAIEKLRFYLLGKKFIARVDHKPLIAMMKNKLNLVMEGWVDTILQYEFDTEYIPGSENVLADALSRNTDDQITISANTIDIKLTGTDIEAAMLWQAEKRGKTIPSLNKQKQLLTQTHQKGHYGVESMFRDLWNSGYWWPQLRKDLKAEVSSCIACLRYEVQQDGYHPSKSIKADQVWDHIQIDLVGPLPTSTDGHTFILTIVDVMSGYTILRALKCKEMQEVASELWKAMCEYGTPKIIQSDNGPEFVNELVQTLTQTFGVEHRLITPYHPRADGLVERTNKELGRALKKFMCEAPAEWHHWLPLLQLSLNDHVNYRTDTRPFTLMFNRAFNDFSNFKETAELTNLHQAVQQRLQDNENFQNIVVPAMKDKNTEVKNNMKQILDKTLKQVSSLKPGTLVMAKDVTKTSKWDPVYEGPFTVVEQHKGEAYTLKDNTDQVLPRRRTIDQLKVLTNTTPPVTEDLRPSYRVQTILDAKKIGQSYEYLVRWHGYGEESDSWVPASDFDDLNIIKKYWKIKTKKPPKSNKTKKGKKSK
jgi:hypothetical protein